jgi:NADH dehydrogenase
VNRVLILGGTGFVGRAVCEALARERPGLRVLVPTRRLAHGDAVRALPNVDLCTADVHDDAALAALLEGCDAVVNLIAILHGSPTAFERVHVTLPQRLAAACERAQLRRLLHITALGADDHAPSHYLRSKTRGAAVLAAADLDLTLLRPSVIFGAHDRFLNLFADLQAFAPVMPLAGSTARFQPVWVGDVAQAVVQALSSNHSVGKTYECAGPDVFTLSEIVRLAGRWAGHERPQIALPTWAGRLQAAVLSVLPGEPLMSADNLDSMSVPNVATGTLPGLADLGIRPTALEAVAPDYLAARFKASGLDRFRARRG